MAKKRRTTALARRTPTWGLPDRVVPVEFQRETTWQATRFVHATRRAAPAWGWVIVAMWVGLVAAMWMGSKFLDSHGDVLGLVAVPLVWAVDHPVLAFTVVVTFFLTKVLVAWAPRWGRSGSGAGSEPEPVPVPVTVFPSWHDAVPSGTMLPVGYSPTTGEVFNLDLADHPHVRVHGKSGSGKTTLLLAVALRALKAGHAVVVADRRGFKDWAGFGDVVEMVDLLPEGAPVAFLKSVEAEVRRRDAVLREKGVRDISGVRGMHRVLVVLDEFGGVLRSLPKGEQRVFKDLVKTVAAEARATGIHLVLGDQKAWNQDSDFLVNLSPVAGRMDFPVDGVGGDPRRLTKYRFLMDGDEFQTWDVTNVTPVGKLPDQPLFEPVPESIPVDGSRTLEAPGTLWLPAGEQARRVWLYLDGHPESEKVEAVRALDGTVSGKTVRREYDAWKKGRG